MGMSASQARLIQLSGRMNDIEYQGQQINQQRTTLASQINELYNSLLDMSVPTPPSVQDFKRTTYKGITGATNFALGTIRPTGNDKYSVDINYTLTGESIKNTNTTKTLVENTPTLRYKNVVDDAKSTLYKEENYTLYTLDSDKQLTTSENIKKSSEVMIKTSATEAQALTKKDGLSFYDKDGKAISDISKAEGEVYVKCSGNKALTEDLKSIVKSTTIEPDVQEGEEIETEPTTTYENVYAVKSQEKKEQVINNRFNPDIQGTEQANKNIAAYGFYMGEPGESNEPVLIQNLADLEDAIKSGNVYKAASTTDSSASTVEFKNPTYSSGGAQYLVNVNGSAVPLYELNSEEGKNSLNEAGVNMDQIVKGLRNAFNMGVDKYENDTDVLKEFSVYVAKSSSGTPTPYFIRNNEIGTVGNNLANTPTYEFSASGTYTKSESKEECQLEFDAAGRITRIGMPNEDGDITWIDLEITSETDEEAYNEAMKDYNYQKVLYDEEQEKVNAQTSIVQAQDKNLELKLTRLDNERNAVKTEIDAVKKVVQDNIESSYKTFSG